MSIRDAGAVVHQATGQDGLALGIHRRQSMTSRQRDDPFPIGVEEGAGSGEHSAGAETNEFFERYLEISAAADIGAG